MVAVVPMYIPRGEMSCAAKVLTQLNEAAPFIVIVSAQSSPKVVLPVALRLPVILTSPVNPAAFVPETVNVPVTTVCPNVEVPAVNAPPFVLII
jgi:hypothetical protein